MGSDWDPIIWHIYGVYILGLYSVFISNPSSKVVTTGVIGTPEYDMFGDPKIGVPNLGSQNRYPKIGVTNVTPIYQSHSIKGLGI